MSLKSRIAVLEKKLPPKRAFVGSLRFFATLAEEYQPTPDELGELAEWDRQAEAEVHAESVEEELARLTAEIRPPCGLRELPALDMMNREHRM
ncbi:MAG TPA: hypothetical protein VHE33_07400 [Acidobacteriaceae bacterium]|nr:hypothetical protein [Acidobacteriaceae bacterium]